MNTTQYGAIWYAIGSTTSRPRIAVSQWILPHCANTESLASEIDSFRKPMASLVSNVKARLVSDIQVFLLSFRRCVSVIDLFFSPCAWMSIRSLQGLPLAAIASVKTKRQASLVAGDRTLVPSYLRGSTTNPVPEHEGSHLANLGTGWACSMPSSKIKVCCFLLMPGKAQWSLSQMFAACDLKPVKYVDHHTWPKGLCLILG